MMNGEERNNQQFQQHHYGGIVQGIPVANDPSAPRPPGGVSQGYIPPPYPPPTTASVPSTGASQNNASIPPPSHHIPGDNPTIGNIPSSAAVGSATATAVGNTTNVHVDLGPHVEIIKDDSLPCGCGSGWFMFIIGWFFAIPWYVGACILICGKIDPRERPGHIACSVMAGIFTVALIITSTHRASNGY